MRVLLATVVCLLVSGCGGTSSLPLSGPVQPVTHASQAATTSSTPHRHHRRKPSKPPQYGSTRVWLTDGEGHLLQNRMGPLLRPSSVRHLPAHGIAVYLSTRPSAEVLVTLGGRVLGHLIANTLPRPPHLNPGWVRVEMGCSTNHARYRICTNEKHSWIADTQTGIRLGTNWLTGLDGHFQSAVASPDGRTLLVGWSGDCEMPEALLVPTDGAPARSAEGAGSAAAAVESEPVGWTPDGRAIVIFLQPACGAGVPEPGVYTVAPPPYPPDPQLIYATRNAMAGAAGW